MRYTKTIKNMTLSGILSAIAILLGVYAKFDKVYLVGIVVFIMPILLSLPYAIVSATISVVLTDVFTGWAGYAWISFIAYLGAVIIIWLLMFLKLKIFYFVSIVIASIFIIASYYVLMKVTISEEVAKAAFIPNIIQSAIVITGASILFWPVKIVKKIL